MMYSTANDFKTYGINITFNVKNSPSCLLLGSPKATILSKDIFDDRIIVRDMDFSSCKSGSLYANVSIFRGIQNPFTQNFSNVYVTNQMSIFVGKIGCDSSCLYCNGSTENSCLLCSDYSNMYLNNGTCVYQCPLDAPYYISYVSTYNYLQVTGYKCQQWCSETTYPITNSILSDDGAIYCQSCFPDCQYCNTNAPQECLMCSPINYLFKGTCLSACPDNDMNLRGVTNEQAVYQMNYTDFTCYVNPFINTVNPLSNINVQLVPLGYRAQIPKDEVTYLKASIYLNRGSNLSIAWKQLDPYVDYQAIENTSDAGVTEDFILEGITTLNTKTGYITATTSYNQLHRSTFNSYSSSIAFRVILKIQNEFFDTNYDIIEFVGNSYPKVGSIFLNSSDPYHNATMSAFITADTVNQSSTDTQRGWYDSYSDDESQLYFMYYINAPDAKYMIKQYTYQKDWLMFQIPFMNGYSSIQLVSLNVYARDQYSACKSTYVYLNVSSTYLPSMRYYPYLSSIFPTILKNGSLAGDTYYQLLVSNFFESTFSQPLLPLYSGALCISDYHCFSNGICTYNEQGRTYCQCNVGYGGALCQLQINEIAYAQLITNATIDLLDQYFVGHTYSDLYINGDLEFIVMIMRGFLKSYDSISISNIYKGLYWMKECMSAHIEVIYTFNKDFYDDFFTVMDRTLGKLHYDLRIMEANLTKTYADIEVYRGSLNETMELYDFCLNEFIRVLLLKMNIQTFYSYTYSGVNINVILNRTLSAAILNNTNLYGAAFFTFGDSDVSIRATSNLLDGIPQVNSVSDLRIKQVKYSASPYIHRSSIDKYLESPVVTVEIMDVLTNKLPINISSSLSKKGSGLFEIAFPYTSFRGYDTQFLTCQSYSEEVGTFVKDGCGLQIFDEFTDDDNNCNNCSYVPSQIAVCFCDHLSTFALIFEPTAQNLLQLPNLGIYTDYYGMNYWSASFGFYAIIGTGGVYVIGIFFAIIFDIRPKKRLKHKLFKDFRNIVKYGLDHDAEEKAEQEEIVNAKTKGKSHKGGKTKTGPIGKDEELKDDDFMGEGKKYNKAFEKSKGNKKKKGDADDDVAIFEQKGSNKMMNKKPVNQQNKNKDQDIDIVEQLDDPNQSQLKDTSMIALKNHETPVGIAYEEMEVDKNPEDKQQLEGGSSEEEEAKEQSKSFSVRSPSKNKSRMDSFPGMVMMKSGRQDAHQNNDNEFEGDSQFFKKAEPRPQNQPKRGGTSSGFNKQKQENPFDNLEQYRGGFGRGDTGGPKQFKGTVAVPKTQSLSNQDPVASRKKKNQMEIVQDEQDLRSEVNSHHSGGTKSMVSGFSTSSKKKNVKHGKKEPETIIEEKDEDFAEIQIQEPNSNESPPTNPYQTQYETESPTKLMGTHMPIKEFFPKDESSTDIKDIRSQTPSQDQQIMGDPIPTQMSDNAKPINKGKKPSKYIDGGASSATDIGESVNGKSGSKLASKQTKGGPQLKSFGMTRISELTHADDNEKRYLRRTDYDNLEEELKDLGLTKEEELYTLCNMIKYGNPILNLFCVDSLLFPRHARWTLLFMNIILIWFFCAVIYSNTYSALTVPDPNKNASSLAYNDLWIAAYAPGANIILMYLFASLFKITDARIRFSSDYNSMKEMLVELQKEMSLRYIMAYFITLAVFSAASWYIVTFTSDFGWKVSWAWWYNGSVAFILNFVIYDFLITFTHFLIYKTCRKLGLCIGYIRSIKQAREEA